MKKRTRFPRAIDPARVDKYPRYCHSGGGFVWDAVLEYRVWCHPERGAPDNADGSDYYFAFASYPEAHRGRMRTRSNSRFRPRCQVRRVQGGTTRGIPRRHPRQNLPQSDNIGGTYRPVPDRLPSEIVFASSSWPTITFS